MKPGLHNYFFAHVISIVVNGGGLVLLILAIKTSWTNFESPHDVLLILQTQLAFAACCLLGVILMSLIVGITRLWPLLSMPIRKMNGGPFAVGDRVLILAGRHKGGVGPIYEFWKERGQLRVYWGEEEKEK